MIQLFENSDSVEVGEIQIEPNHQNQKIGSRVLRDTIARAHEQRKKVVLSVALKNDRAYRLYQSLGFQNLGQNETHNLMACEPCSGDRGQVATGVSALLYSACMLFFANGTSSAIGICWIVVSCDIAR